MKYHAGKKLYELEAHRKYTARMNRLEVVTDLLKLMRKRILTSQIALGLKSSSPPTAYRQGGCIHYIIQVEASFPASQNINQNASQKRLPPSR